MRNGSEFARVEDSSAKMKNWSGKVPSRVHRAVPGDSPDQQGSRRNGQGSSAKFANAEETALASEEMERAGLNT